MGKPDRDSYNSLWCLVSIGYASISNLSESVSFSASVSYPSNDSIRSIDYGNPSPNLLMHKRNTNENYPEGNFADATQSDAANSAAVACVKNDVRKRQKTSTRWKPFSSTGRRSSTVVQRAFDGRELGPPPSRYKKVTSELSTHSCPESPSSEPPVSRKGFPRHVQSLSRRLQDGRDYSPLYIWRSTCPQSRSFPRGNYSKENFAHTMRNDPAKAAVVACVETNVPKRQRKSRTRWRPFSSNPSNRRELESTPTQPEIPLDLNISASRGRMPASLNGFQKKRKKNEVS